MAEDPETISVVSDIDGKRCKLVIKSGLRRLTVANMKKHLVTPIGVPAAEQQLSFNGVVLEDHQTCHEAALRRGSVVRLAMRRPSSTAAPPPPPPPPAPAPPRQPSPRRQQQANPCPPQQNSAVSFAGGRPEADGDARTAYREAAQPRPPDAGLRPDMAGRERQKDAELRELHRRAEEFGQPALRPDAGAGDAVFQRPPPPTGPVDDMQMHERRSIEAQSMMQEQIERERQRVHQLQHNMADRQERHERMISNAGTSHRERELEQHVQELQAENQNAAKLRMDNQALKRELDASDAQLQRKLAENEQLRARVAEFEKNQASNMLHSGMTGLELAKRNLAEFGRELGVEAELDFDDNLTCVVGVEQRYTILLTYDQTTERLYIYSTLLTYLPKEPAVRLKLYEMLLEGALMGREMSGGGVGLSMKNELLLMATSVDLKHSDVNALKSVAPVFVDCLVRWRQTVKDRLMSDEPRPAQSPAAKPAALQQPPYYNGNDAAAPPQQNAHGGPAYEYYGGRTSSPVPQNLNSYQAGGSAQYAPNQPAHHRPASPAAFAAAAVRGSYPGYQPARVQSAPHSSKYDEPYEYSSLAKQINDHEQLIASQQQQIEQQRMQQAGYRMQ
ncbi:hypothetical protein DIPPA_05500 [Diplonema papillatum]|nr:hypothetical protein DIPPA_05500 [Diplonema papillatum]